MTKQYEKSLLEKMIYKYPNKPWNWAYLSANPNISKHFIEQFINFPWRWDYVSCNKNINLDFVLKYIEKPWNWETLSENLKLKLKEKYYNQPWEYTYLCFNKYLSIHFIKNMLERVSDVSDWNWDELSLHCNITISDIIENKELPWNWENVSYNPNLTLKDIINHPDLPWDYYILSHSDIITMDFILENINKDWNWHALSSNKNITIDDIENNPDLPWIQLDVFDNPNLTIEYVKKHLDIKNADYNSIEMISILSNTEFIKLENVLNYTDFPWDWYYLSKKIHLNFIKKNPELPWNWKGISENRSLTYDFIIENLDKNWCHYYLNINFNNINDYPFQSKLRDKKIDIESLKWSYLSKNEYITKEDIEKNIDNINFTLLSKNNFNYNNTYLTNKYYKNRRQQTINNTLKFKEELMIHTWHPNRFQEWCLDIEEKQEYI